MDLLTSHPKMQNANNILYRICNSLQKRDIKNGYHTGDPNQGNYMQSYFHLHHNPHSTLATFCFHDILDDACNCNLITDAEYDYLDKYYNKYNSH